VAAPTAAPAPRAASNAPADAWRAVLASFESKPVLGMRLANANVTSFESGTLTLAFVDRFEVDKVEKARKEIEEAVAAVVGQPTKVVFVVGSASTPTLLKSEMSSDLDALAAERKSREVEARQHPLIQKAQDVFNTSLKEIKPFGGGPN
jgi:hypothetical protein